MMVYIRHGGGMHAELLTPIYPILFAATSSITIRCLNHISLSETPFQVPITYYAEQIGLFANSALWPPP